MTTRTQSNPNTRTYTCLADVPSAAQEGILMRLVTRHAARVASRFRGTGSLDAEDMAVTEAYRTFSNLQTFRLNVPHTVEQVERFLVNRYYHFAPVRVHRFIARGRAHGVCSLEELTENAGDGAIPESDNGVPSLDMNEVDVYDLLAFLGVHEDWQHLFSWVAMQRLKWHEVVERLRYHRGITFDEPTLRKRWSRICGDLGPGVAAGVAGLPLEAFRLKPGHWAARPMKEPNRRGR